MEPKEHESCSVTVGSLRDAILRHVRYTLGREEGAATPRDLFTAVALATRDRIVDRMLATEGRYVKAGAKRVHYLSMEFLLGKLLENNLACLGLREVAREAVESLGGDWEAVVDSEPDAGLGNGGLGRLAAC
jgi:glycogen phosphorylase